MTQPQSTTGARVTTRAAIRAIWRRDPEPPGDREASVWRASYLAASWFQTGLFALAVVLWLVLAITHSGAQRWVYLALALAFVPTVYGWEQVRRRAKEAAVRWRPPPVQPKPRKRRK